MHDRGLNEADVTEGSDGVWERLHYDWADPNRVVLTVTDSNMWSPHSGYTYTITPRPDGTTDVDVVNVREGKNLKGRVLALLLSTVGKRVLVNEVRKDHQGDRSPELHGEPGRFPHRRDVLTSDPRAPVAGHTNRSRSGAVRSRDESIANRYPRHHQGDSTPRARV